MPPWFRPAGITAPKPELSAGAGRSSSSVSMRWTRWCARGASQNAYVDDGFPERVLVTHQAHPLVGRELKVVRRINVRSEPFWVVVLPDGSRSEPFWVVVLPDGSRCSIRCSWTNVSAASEAGSRAHSGRRARAAALRELVSLVEVLACRAGLHEPPGDNSQGDEYEHAAEAVRGSTSGVDRAAVGDDQSGAKGGGADHLGGDGQERDRCEEVFERGGRR